MFPKDTRSQNIKTWVTYALSALIVIAFLYYVIVNRERFLDLLDLSPDLVGLMVGMTLILIIGSGVINLMLYREFGAELTFIESIGLAAVNSLANLLPFSAGLIAKAVYLKERHQLAYSQFIVSTLALQLTFVSTSGLLGLVVMLVLELVVREQTTPLVYLGFFLMSISSLILMLPLDARIKPSRLKKFITPIWDGWRILRRNPLLVMRLVVVQLLMSVAFAWRLWAAFKTLSHPVMIAQCLLFSSASVLSHFISITPSGLGVREAIVAALSSMLGFDLGVSTVAVGIDRIVSSAVIAIAGVAGLKVLGRSKHPESHEPD
jgi:uncharacterized membrane protein YbhN (UPF0104 family)